MSKPKFEVQEKEYYKEIHFLYEILNSLKDVSETKMFIKDMLTKSEVRMLKRRWHIATLLQQGLPIRTVAKKAKTSTTTVAKIYFILHEGTGGLRLALAKANITKIKQDKKSFSRPRIGGSKLVNGWFR